MNRNLTDAAKLLLKVGLMAIVILLLLIPLSMVKTQIREREATMETSIYDVESSWGRSQYLEGPKIKFTYDVQSKDEKGKTVVKKETRDLFPMSLKYIVNAETKNLHRSIYDVTVYNASVQMMGTFIVPDEMRSQASASIIIGLSDLRGIEGEAFIDFNGKKYDFVAANNAIWTTVQLPGKDYVSGNELNFDMKFKLKGSENLQFAPIGNLTEIEMTSNCKTPSFVGAFLPTERSVDEKGFSAKWIVSQINRGEPESTAFGVSMLQPVTQYQQTTRCVKYGIIVILLVFLAGFFVELMTKKDINILQYLIIGLSLVLFYSLLLSFSEIISFGLSYLVSAAMTTIALTGYYRGILKAKIAYLLGGFVAIAYGTNYILLQLEHFALLGGTLVLFVCLIVLMHLTKDTGPIFH